MNRIDSCLERLFKAAASVPEDLPLEAPFPLETRVLASWRYAASAEEPSVFQLPVIRGAFLCACAVLLISAAVTFHSLRESPPANELVIVDSFIQLTLMQ